MAAARLRDIGLNIPEAADQITEPNLALYEAVCESGGDHFDYNAVGPLIELRQRRRMATPQAPRKTA